ncbi:hypothetical protein PSTH1771_22845 [Pseudomonas syringae pv. theae]|nr:hypothetical protein [Pseudomonas syringae]GKS07907.1 hypothetical protein PSTH1771_22845 [Pseudomonas syringae pv. theae]
MTYSSPTPFLNVTPLGVRQKITPLTTTSTPGVFANVLQKSIHEKEAPHYGKTILRGGELRHTLMAQAENNPSEASFLAKQYAHNSLNGEGVDLSDYLTLPPRNVSLNPAPGLSI